MMASRADKSFCADSKSGGSAARASSRSSSISPRCTTQLAESGTPRASSTNVIADANFSTESMDYFPPTRSFIAVLTLAGIMLETSPP